MAFIAQTLPLKGERYDILLTYSLARSKNKRIAIESLLNKHSGEKSLAFGDSEADEDMLASVELAICINPTDGLRKVAEQKGWYILHPEEVLPILGKVQW